MESAADKIRRGFSLELVEITELRPKRNYDLNLKNSRTELRTARNYDREITKEGNAGSLPKANSGKVEEDVVVQWFHLVWSNRGWKSEVPIQVRSKYSKNGSISEGTKGLTNLQDLSMSSTGR